MRWTKLVNRSALMLAVVLCVAATTALTAQQRAEPVGLAPQRSVSAAPASATTSVPVGPRLHPAWQQAAPSIRASSSAAPLPSDTHTFTVTTLVLVLVIVIAVLLLVR